MDLGWEEIPLAVGGYFVYAMWGDDPDRPVYVGRSTNPLSRIGTHLMDSSKAAAVRRLTFFRCASEAEMKGVEVEQILVLQPYWNKVYGPADPEPPYMAPPPKRLSPEERERRRVMTLRALRINRALAERRAVGE